MTDLAETSLEQQPTKKERNNADLSRPVFKRVLKVNSLQAQRVVERSFQRVSDSLFSIDVILRIIGEQDEIDQVESIIQEHIEKVSVDLDTATNQLQKLMEDNGIEGAPEYTSPNQYDIEINSPQVAQFAHLVRKLDNLMLLVDTLWLNSILTSKQRKDATYQWQQRLIKLAGTELLVLRSELVSQRTPKARKMKLKQLLQLKKLLMKKLHPKPTMLNLGKMKRQLNALCRLSIESPSTTEGLFCVSHFHM